MYSVYERSCSPLIDAAVQTAQQRARPGVAFGERQGERYLI